MKKALSVFLAFILMLGICAAGASAVEIEEPVYNYSYKSGDVVDLSSFYNEIRPYQQLGIPVHLKITHIIRIIKFFNTTILIIYRIA